MSGGGYRGRSTLTRKREKAWDARSALEKQRRPGGKLIGHREKRDWGEYDSRAGKNQFGGEGKAVFRPLLMHFLNTGLPKQKVTPVEFGEGKGVRNQKGAISIGSARPAGESS